MKTIGLSMIVKNEAHVVRRCLDSALPLIDYVLVVDTGSSDGTQDVVRAWLRERQVAGEVIDEPWRNFAYNRSFALEKLREQHQVDYALVIDADDALECDPGLDIRALKAGLDADVYDIPIHHGVTRYPRPLLFSNRMPFRYKGVLHEYLECPEGHRRGEIAGLRIRLRQESARNKNPNKYADDARTLEKALASETDPFLIARYTFYLARSHNDSGDPLKALKYFTKRIEQGYWVQEIYISLLSIAEIRIRFRLPPDDVLAAYRQAIALCPDRAEAYHGAALYLRGLGRFAEAYAIAKPGLGLTPPKDGLFVAPWVYTHGLLDEFAVSAYWSGHYDECLETCRRILARDDLDADFRRRVEANVGFAQAKIAEAQARVPAAKAPARAGTRTLCLNMIVKNEMANLPRCLAAIAPYIDCWVIADTGSTDGTQDFIRQFFAARGIPGELHTIPFVNFGETRNRALSLAYASPLAFDYLLLADADMELFVDTPDFRAGLEADAYLLRQQGEGLTYWNTRLARRACGAKYRGVTHEYLDIPGETLRLDGAWYMDHASGANRGNKLERDIVWLKQAIDKDPDDHRSWYYLAMSYHHTGRYKEAAEAYAKRATMGGWEEEAWNAQLQEARCRRLLGNEAGFLGTALKALARRPQRAEPLYDLAQHYRERRLFDISLLFSEPGLVMAPPEGDILFVEDYIYTVGLREEYYIAANYSPNPARKARGHAICEWLALSKTIPTPTRDLARRNLLFYVPPIKELLPSFAPRKIDFAPPDGYRPVNPSVSRRNDEIVMVQRAVNYVLTRDGQYRTNDGGPIRTRNFLLRLDPRLGTKSAAEILPPADWPAPAYDAVIGFEDMRLFHWRGDLWCSSTTRELHADGWCQQILTRIEQAAPGHCRLTDWRVMAPKDPIIRHEKNWMPRIAANNLSFIYSCDPTRIVDAQAKTLAETVPAIAGEEFRGGSQAIEFEGGWLALIHEVTFHGDRRFYFHRFVWLDANNEIRRISQQFYLHHRGVEFVAGLARHPDGNRLIISYGVADAESWLATVSAAEVRAIIEDVGRPPP